MIYLFLVVFIPSIALAQDISSPYYFSTAPEPVYQTPPPPPPAIDLTPTYAYQNQDPARSITILPSTTLEPTYLYPGGNPGDPITVVRPNGTIYYLYPGRSR